MNEPTDPTTVNPYAAPPLEQSEIATLPTPALPMDEEVRALFARGKNGAAWFYWIAALTMINSVIMLTGGQWNFSLGLTFTFFADAIATVAVQQGNPEWIKFAVFGFDLVVICLVALCGWLAQKRILPVFAIGMFLYLLDTPLAILTGFLGVGIHLFALWGMWNGFSAYRQLNAMEQQLAMSGGR
jgi:hypothetical protein